jgi:DNA-directed RNA polymerase subunit beta
MLLPAVEEANAKLGPGKQTAEFEAHSDYLSAWEEDKYIIAQANVGLDPEGNIVNDLVNARQAGNFVLKHRDEIEYMDVSPKQLVSVAASLIPFLENDDANRALMGSNMQRQAVPLLRADAPYVGTGMERVTARDSGAVVICKRSGMVDSVDSERIIVRVEGAAHEGQMSREVGADIYQMTKFKRSNQNTCITQKPIVAVGQRVKKGDVLADGPCTDKGELALGRNVLVAFMPWRGYNFEDAIVVSEKLVKEDYYTSIHIEEFEIEARDTKLGPEEITPRYSEHRRDVPPEPGRKRHHPHRRHGEAGRHSGRQGHAEGRDSAHAGRKTAPRDLRRKAGDVKDASLYCPPGIEGTIVDCKVFSRKGAELDERSKAILGTQEERMHRNLEDEKRILNDERSKRLANLLDNREVLADLHDEKTNKKLVAKGVILNRETIEKMRARDLKRLRFKDKDPHINEQIDEIEEMTSRQIAVLEKITEEKIAKLRKGDELPPGVIKLVKCYIAMKRKLSVGDKMAGRHGNKGVIARIVPEEDMPYLPDGTPVEIVLNPLGVPSRMNVGQILETHLGWAAASWACTLPPRCSTAPRKPTSRSSLPARSAEFGQGQVA